MCDSLLYSAICFFYIRSIPLTKQWYRFLPIEAKKCYQLQTVKIKTKKNSESYLQLKGDYLPFKIRIFISFLSPLRPATENIHSSKPQQDQPSSAAEAYSQISGHLCKQYNCKKRKNIFKRNIMCYCYLWTKQRVEISFLKKLIKIIFCK